jgi:peptidoglycan/xylan/chitin deacetylase (PgdA/CDA1 family)
VITRIRSRRALAGLALLGAGALIAADIAAPSPIAAHAVNPLQSPIPVVVDVPVAQVITVRVIRVADAVVVATLGPVNAMVGPVTIPWSGGRGPGGTGQPVADGTYRFEGIAADGVSVLTTRPTSVDVDTGPPMPVITAPALTIPPSAATSLSLRAGGAREVRAIVRRPGRDAPIATGAWQPAGTTLVLPRVLRSRGVVGPVTVTPEGRDAAGNIGTGTPVAWALQPPAGAPMVVRRIRTTKPLVAITVDDGYGPAESLRMIDAARAARATLTFCFNAINQSMWSASWRATLARAVADGVVEMCNHGYSHRTSRSSGEAFGYADLRGNVGWDRIGGATSAPFYRPPYGDYGPGLRAAARRTGYRYVVMWDVDTNDWRGPSASAITQRAVGGARRGSIILMHTKPNSAAAMAGIIRGLRAKGLEPVGLGELFSAGRPG